MGLIASVSNRIGKLLSGGTTPDIGSAATLPQLPLYQQYSRIGGNLTPAQVSAILQEADAGSMRRLMDLSNEARQKDGHLHAVLSTRENALNNLELIIDPAIEYGAEEPTPIAQEIAQAVNYALSCAIGYDQEIRSLQDTIAQLNGGVYFGYSVDEIMWTISEGMIVPFGFIPINQRRFEFGLTSGRLLWRDYYTMVSGVDLKETYPGKFMVHQPRVNGDVPAREGLNRLLVWCALFRNWSTADWLKLAELAWKPWRIGKYSMKANDKDREELLEALQKLTTNGVAVHRIDHELNIIYPAGMTASARGSLGPHQSLCEFMGSEMSKAVLGQTLTTEQGDRGARSLGEVHDRVRRDIREFDAISVASTLRRDLVSWIVKLNFGDDKLIPNVRFSTDDAVDLEQFSNAISNLSNAGVAISEAWVHDKLGHPEVSEDTVLIGEEAASDDLIENGLVGPITYADSSR